MTIGDRIKQARCFAGLTQSELATLLGIQCSHRQRVSQWEHNTATPKLATIEDIARITGTVPAWITYGVGGAPKERATE